MSYFEDNDNDSNSDAGSDNGSDNDSNSDAGSDLGTSAIKPKTVINLEGDDGEDLDNGSIAESDDDDLAEGGPFDEEEEGEIRESKGDDDDDDDEDDDVIVEDGEEIIDSKKTKHVKISETNVGKRGPVYVDDDDDEDDDETGELYLKKFDKDVNDNYLLNFHPECALHNYDEVLALSKVIRDKHGIIVDDLHKTIPFITKYERARVLGQRAKQINSGASIFVKVPEDVLDGYLIAELELIEKRIPFIIRRPLPNGGSEYWSIKDLENISF